MGLSTAVSVASFSVVLAESFSAVMLSTLVPATFIEVANTVKRVAKAKAANGETVTDDDLNGDPNNADDDGLLGPLGDVPGLDTVNTAIATVAAATAEPTELQMLLPSTATIDAEFEFHGGETYSAAASVGAQVKLVTINAGYSALYTTSSSNKLKLHIEFASVPVQIGD